MTGYDSGRPGLEVVQHGPDRWGWRYVDHVRAQVLTGNDTFSSEDEAVHSATAAYPDIDNVSIHRRQAEAGSRAAVDVRAEALRLGLALGAALAGALVLRALRDRGS